MSYEGTGNAAHYLKQTEGYLTKYPIVFSGWIKPSALGNQTIQALLVSGDATGTNYTEIAILGTRAALRRRTAADIADCSSDVMTTGVWQHVMGYAHSAGGSVWLNGGARANEATAVAIPSGIDRHYIGVLGRETAGNAQPLTGLIGECAVWMGWTPPDLDALAVRLAAGGSPLAEDVHPFDYFRLRSNTNPEPEARSGMPSLDLNGFTFSTDDPTVDDPPSGGGGGGTGVNIPNFEGGIPV